MIRRVTIVGAAMAGLTTLGLGTGVASAAPASASAPAGEIVLAADPRTCSQGFRDTLSLTMGGAGLGFTVGGPWGAAVGAVGGFVAGASGGCTETITGTPHPAP